MTNKLETLGPGPWVDEPDEVDFEAHGYPCQLRRVMESGHWCGYVIVPRGHPWYGVHLHSLVYADVVVHGGITYARTEGDNGWCVGFDCGHAFDVKPGTEKLLREHLPPHLQAARAARPRPLGLPAPTYRDLAYAREETEGLALQAHEAAAKNPKAS